MDFRDVFLKLWDHKQFAAISVISVDGEEHSVHSGPDERIVGLHPQVMDDPPGDAFFDFKSGNLVGDDCVVEMW